MYEAQPVPHGSLLRFSWRTFLIPLMPVILTGFVFTVVRLSLGVSRQSALEQLGPLSGFMLYITCTWVVVGGLAWSVVRGGLSWKDLGLRTFGVRDGFVAVGAAIVGVMIVFPISQALAGWIGLPPIARMAYDLDSVSRILLAVVACGVIGPLGEEIVFRGFLVESLRTRISNPWVYGSLATVIFAAIHLPGFGASGALFILLWTPMIVALYVRTNSLYPGYIAHVLNNLFAYVAVPLFLS